MTMDVLSHFIVGLNYLIHITHTHTHAQLHGTGRNYSAPVHAMKRSADI